MKAIDIPSDKFPIPFADAAGGSYIRNIPVASQIGITSGAASLTDGFPPLNFSPVGSGGVPPFGQDFNGLLKQITEWTQWQNAGALVAYDASFSTAIGGYPKGAIVAGTTAGQIWLCTVDDNTTNPNSGGAGWILLATSSSSQTSAWSYAGTFGGTANALTATLSPAPASLTAGLIVRGVVSATNTGAVTLNVNGLGATNVSDTSGVALVSASQVAGQEVVYIYDGTKFQKISSWSSTIQANVTKTVAASGGDFTTIAEAMAWLAQWRIAYGVTVTIQVASGTFALSGCVLDHPNSGQIVIQGTMIGAAPVYANFVLTGPSAPQRASDNATNLAMVRTKYGTEFQVPANVLGFSVPGGSGRLLLKDVLITGASTSTPIDVATGGMTLSNVTVYGGNVNIKSGVRGTIQASDCWSFGAATYGWAAFNQSLIFGSGANSFSNGTVGFYGAANSCIDLGVGSGGSGSRAFANGTYGFQANGGVMSLASTASTSNGTTDTRAQNNAAITMLTADGSSTGSASPTVNTVGNANSYIAS